MVRRWGMMAAFILTLAMALPVMAQQNEKSTDSGKQADATWNFYRLTLTVREMDGTKITSSKSYDYSQRSKSWGSLRVGSRVPIPTGNGGLIQYQEIGFNVDSRIEDRDNQLGFDWRFELTSLASDPDSHPSDTHPVVRSIKSDGQTLLTPGKPAIVSTVDDLNSTHKFVFEVTATKIK